MDNNNPNLISLNQFRFESGYWCGMLQPSALFLINLSEKKIISSVLNEFDSFRSELFSVEDGAEISKIINEPYEQREPIIRSILEFTLSILLHMKMPIMSGVRSFKVTPRQSAEAWCVGIPAISRDIPAPMQAIIFACGLMNELARGSKIDKKILEIKIKELVDKFRRFAPAGVNTLRFLQAAHDEKIPWRHLGDNLYQFGWGSNSRWLDSSLTDEASRISVAIARDKVASLKILREAGLPVPKHQLVGSADQAAEIAGSLGYPVVIKPANLDGGRGVVAGLYTPDSVRRVYSEVASISRKILVEEFVVGSDYRLQVFRGEVFWVSHRSPAKIVGDGVRTVKELIERTNEERKRRSILKPFLAGDPMVEQGREQIHIDGEVLDRLHVQDLTLESIPEPEQEVRLRGAANVSLGGTRAGVLLDEIHPDNIELVTQAASILRLDLAGVDLLIPDISRSWREIGGAICEVNAQPQISGHLHRKLLPRLVPGNGRIPIVIILNLPKRLLDLVAIKGILSRNKIRLGWAQTISQCRSALLYPNINFLVWQLDKWPDKLSSWPVDKIDGVFIFSEENDPVDISQLLPIGVKRPDLCLTFNHGQFQSSEAMTETLVQRLLNINKK